MKINLKSPPNWLVSLKPVPGGLFYWLLNLSYICRRIYDTKF